MSDASDVSSPEAGADRIDEVLHRFERALHSHEDLTKGEIERLNRDLRNTLEDFSAADKREKDELREAIKRSQDWIDQETKARSERDRVRTNRTTLVVPPNDTAIQETSEAPTGEVTTITSEGEEEERSFWKKIW